MEAVTPPTFVCNGAVIIKRASLAVPSTVLPLAVIFKCAVIVVFGSLAVWGTFIELADVSTVLLAVARKVDCAVGVGGSVIFPFTREGSVYQSWA